MALVRGSDLQLLKMNRLVIFVKKLTLNSFRGFCFFPSQYLMFHCVDICFCRWWSLESSRYFLELFVLLF